MIGLRITNTNGLIEVFDSSNLTESFSRAFIELSTLGLSKELNSGSNPSIGTFLSPSTIVGVEFPTETDKVITIKYTLLSGISSSGLTYVVGNNLVYKTGIYNLFSGTDKIYIDQLYTIDKTKSTSDMLFLTEPIEASSSTVYLAYYLEKCVTVFNKIVCELKSATFDMTGECCDGDAKERLDNAYRLIEAIKIQQECNDCEKQRTLLKKLKNTLGVC